MAQTFPEPPKEMQFIYQKVVPVLSAVAPLIQEFEDSEHRISFLRRALKPQEDLFIAMVQSKRGNQEKIPLEAAIRLYGPRNGIDLITALTLYQSVQEEPAKWSEGGEPEIQIEEWLSVTLQLREAFGGNHRSDFELRVCGLVFDILMALARKHSSQAKKIEELTLTQVEQGIELSAVAHQLARDEGNLQLVDILEAAIFLKRTGRILMAIIHDNYLDFADQLIKNDFRSPFAHLAEIKAYGVSNNVVSSMLCKFIPKLNPVNAALLFYDYPFMLQDGVSNDSIYHLVSLCHEVDKMGRQEISHK